MHTVITKMEWCSKQGCVKYTLVGFTDDQEYCDVLNRHYDCTFECWIKENPSKSAEIFFNDIPELYVARTTVMRTDGMVQIITK
jgi:hypothetical protein